MRKTVFWLILASLGNSWASVADDENIDERKAIQKIELLGGSIRSSVSLPQQPVVAISFYRYRATQVAVQPPIRFNEKYMRLLKPFPLLATLDLGNNEVSDEGLNALKEIKSLRALNLEGTKVTDAGLKYLGELPELQSLSLSHTGISDVGLQEIGRLTRLKKLVLSQTEITDQGLKDLAGLKELNLLDLRDTPTTVAGQKLLAKSLPNVKTFLSDPEDRKRFPKMLSD